MQDNELCPIDAIVAYKLVRGIDSGQFFCVKKGNPLTKAHFIGKMRKALPAVGLQQDQYVGHSFCSANRPGGLDHQTRGQME